MLDFKDTLTFEMSQENGLLCKFFYANSSTATRVSDGTSNRKRDYCIKMGVLFKNGERGFFFYLKTGRDYYVQNRVGLSSENKKGLLFENGDGLLLKRGRYHYLKIREALLFEKQGRITTCKWGGIIICKKSPENII